MTPLPNRNETDSVTEELRAALGAHGITLPSLGTDPVTAAGSYPCPLVSLGNCPADTARRLAAVLREARGEGTVAR